MTPNEIRGKQFERKRGAYRVEEVGDYLIEVAQYVETVLEDKRDLEAKLTVLADKLEEYRADEESLRAALIGAQKLGDSVVRDAKAKAERLLSEASVKAEQIVSDAKSSLDREALALTRMQGQVAAFKDQVLDMYRRQLETIKAITEEYNFPVVEPPAAPPPLVRQPSIAEPEPVTYAAVAPREEPVFESALAVDTEPEQPAPPSPEPALTFKRAERVDSFVLSYDELDELPEDTQQPMEAGAGQGGAQDPPPQHRRRSNFGDLRFGEEYNLTRKD